MVPSYVLATCQPTTRVVFEEGVFQPELLEANVDHFCGLILQAARAHDAKLIVFPQFGLSGFAAGITIDEWVRASITLPGPQIERLGRVARDASAYVLIHATERHDHFPGRYFSSAALIGPNGRLCLVYRKHYVLTTRARPIDIYDRFVDHFGTDGLYPVADTPLGRIGVVIAGEVNWPEAVRSLALRGAEVVLNPTASAPGLDYLGRPGALAVRAARAFENQTYLAMANHGAFVSAADGGASSVTAPPSEVYDYNGALIAVAPQGADQFALATIDLEALRTARAEPARNFLAQIQPQIHRVSDPRGHLWPVNAFAEARVEQPEELTRIASAVWAGLSNH